MQVVLLTYSSHKRAAPPQSFDWNVIADHGLCHRPFHIEHFPLPLNRRLSCPQKAGPLFELGLEQGDGAKCLGNVSLPNRSHLHLHASAGVSKLREAEVLLAQGKTTAEASRSSHLENALR
jgi:hypothetical protein